GLLLVEERIRVANGRALAGDGGGRQLCDRDVHASDGYGTATRRGCWLTCEFLLRRGLLLFLQCGDTGRLLGQARVLVGNGFLHGLHCGFELFELAALGGGDPSGGKRGKDGDGEKSARPHGFERRISSIRWLACGFRGEGPATSMTRSALSSCSR